MHRYIQRHRVSLHLDARDGFGLSLMVMAGVLAGGRAIEILFDEWPFYRDHASPAVNRQRVGYAATVQVSGLDLFRETAESSESPPVSCSLRAAASGG